MLLERESGAGGQMETAPGSGRRGRLVLPVQTPEAQGTGHLYGTVQLCQPVVAHAKTPLARAGVK
ncbi:MAG: hypothetical protein EBQ96_09465 [Proteobacteria bacterium]|nr:hypothetical protein [Pseudomonadota bacterium]